MNNEIKAINAVADAVLCQKEAEKTVKESFGAYYICGVDCDPDRPSIHIYDGIETLAAELGAEIEVKPRMDEYEYWSIMYNGVEVFQLKEKGAKDDLSDQ